MNSAVRGSRIWHGVLACIIVLALAGQTSLVFTTEGRSLLNLYSYFTIQSNVLILIASVLIAIHPDRRGNGWTVLRLAGLVGITVTGIVYATILAGTTDFSGVEWWYDKAFHYVVPIGAMLGFFLFTPRTRFARSDLVFVAWPIVWLGYTLVRGGVSNPGFAGAHGSRADYPYDFLDVDTYGYGQVSLNAVLVTVVVLGIAGLYVRFSSRKVGDTVTS